MKTEGRLIRSKEVLETPSAASKQTSPLDRRQQMASLLFHSVTAGEENMIADVAWRRDAVVIAVEEYMLRLEAKRGGSNASARLHRLQRAVVDHKLIIIPHPAPSATWWHRQLILQPDCSISEAFDDSYISRLHRLLTSPSSLQTADEGVEACDASQTSGSGGSGGSGDDQQRGDPILSLARTMQKHANRQLVIVDGLDSALLVALWEMHRRRNASYFADDGGSSGSSGSGRREEADIWLSSRPFPDQGLSVHRFEEVMRQRYGLCHAAEWQNLLVCLPMVIDVGLPPLLMLQYAYREDVLERLANAVATVTDPILRLAAPDSASGGSTDANASFFDLISLARVLERLLQQGPSEAAACEIVADACIGRTDESAKRELCDVKTIGWSQFRRLYYFVQLPKADAKQSVTPCSGADAELNTVVHGRCMAWLSGLLQLTSIYRGQASEHHILSTIAMDDAPLVTDLLQVVACIAKKSRYISLPDQPDHYVEQHQPSSGSTISSVRTLVRLHPLFLSPMHA